MNTTRRSQLIDSCRLLQSHGWVIDTTEVNTYHFHSGHETPEHATAKLLLCKAIKDMGYSFASELPHETRGTVDVMDIHEGGKGSYIYEVETKLDRETEIAKVNQYTDGMDADEIADVFVLDVAEVPKDINEAWQWAHEQVVP